MSKYFKKTYFICEIRNEIKNFNTKLDTNKAEPIKISFNIAKSTILSNLTNLIKDNLNLARMVTKKSVVLIHSSMIWFTPVLPILSIKSSYLVSYVATNQEEVAKLQSSRTGISNTFKSTLTLLYGWLVLNLSDSILIRGDIAKYKKYGINKLHESRPIISLSKNKFSSRNDTCNGKEITLLYVGGIYERKGIDVLIKAFSNLVEKANHKSLRLKIIGGTKQQLLRILSQPIKSDIYERIEFLGWIDNNDKLAEEYLASDILVVPSLIAEGQPRVIDEGMYYRIPIIATDLGYGNSFKNRENILFIKPNSVEDLEKAIEEIVSSEQLRTRIIENGKKRMEHLNTYSAARQHAEIFLGLKKHE